MQSKYFIFLLLLRAGNEGGGAILGMGSYDLLSGLDTRAALFWQVCSRLHLSSSLWHKIVPFSFAGYLLPCPVYTMRTFALGLRSC